MKASNVDQLLRMLKPDDGMYGFYKLSNSDAEKLVKLYRDRGVLRGVSSLAEAKKILWESTYKGDRKDVYGADLIKSGALEVPGPLKGLSVKAIREKLTKHKMYSYTFRVSFESSYKNAIKVLQQSLNISVTGRYTEDVARAVYEKVKGDIPKKKGYLASEDDPDRLFKSGFQEYVFCVDKVVWELCGIEEKFLADDGGTVWKEHGPDKESDSDAQCRKILTDMDAFGSSYVVSGGVNGRVGEIFRDAEDRARQILDWIFAQEIISIFPRSTIYKSSLEKYQFDLKEAAKNQYELATTWKPILVWVLNELNFLVSTASDAAVFFPFFFIPSLQWVGAVGVLTVAVLNLSSPEPGWGDALDATWEVTPEKMENEAYNYNLITNSDWKYMVQDTALDARGQAIKYIKANIEAWKVKGDIYSSSAIETELYNRLIIEYLENVVFINEQYDIMNKGLDQLLKD